MKQRSKCTRTGLAQTPETIIESVKGSTLNEQSVALHSTVARNHFTQLELINGGTVAIRRTVYLMLEHAMTLLVFE